MYWHCYVEFVWINQIVYFEKLYVRVGSPKELRPIYCSVSRCADQDGDGYKDVETERDGTGNDGQSSNFIKDISCQRLVIMGTVNFHGNKPVFFVRFALLACRFYHNKLG